jgi:UDP-N-acetylmuramate--alanine ligase
VAVFQPHRYSRTRALLAEFSTAFYQADRLFVTEIYPAGEAPIPGVSGRQIADGVTGHGHRDVRFVPDKAALAAAVAADLEPGDMVLTLGAGDVWRVGEEILERLRAAGR